VHVRAKIGTAGAKFHRIDIPGDYPTALSFTPDSKLLIVATSIAKHVQFYTISSKYVLHCHGATTGPPASRLRYRLGSHLLLFPHFCSPSYPLPPPPSLPHASPFLPLRRMKHLPEKKSDFATSHNGEITCCPTASFPFLPLSVFVTTIAGERDTVLDFWSPRGALLARLNTNQVHSCSCPPDVVRGGPCVNSCGVTCLTQVENYDVTVSADAKYISVASWHSEARVWHASQKAGSFDKVVKVSCPGVFLSHHSAHA
jgi:hypothetical protein